MIKVSRILLAAPVIIERGIFYLKAKSSGNDPRFLELSYFSPTFPQESRGQYRLEVGDWDVDGNFKGAALKQSLKKSVYPLLRGDAKVQDAIDQQLLEKILTKLVAVIHDLSSDYFSTPMEQKSTWQKVLRLDLTKYMDTKVELQTPDGGSERVASIRA